MRKFPLMPTRKQWRDWSLPAKLTAVGTALAVVACLVWAIGIAWNQLDAWLANPRPRVSLQKTTSEICLRLRMRSPTSSVAIDVPVLGTIKKIHDYNSPVDAVVASKLINGSNSADSQNNVEITLTDVKPNRDISFKILYEPTPTKFDVIGTDRWQLSYSWFHNGAVQTRAKLLGIADRKEVDPPPAQVKAATIIHRALSPEEIKKDYENGPPRIQRP